MKYLKETLQVQALLIYTVISGIQHEMDSIKEPQTQNLINRPLYTETLHQRLIEGANNQSLLNYTEPSSPGFKLLQVVILYIEPAFQIQRDVTGVTFNTDCGAPHKYPEKKVITRRKNLENSNINVKQS